MKLISACVLSCLLLMGCATKESPQVIYVTEYQEVKVPVIYKLQRPKRPIYLSTDTTPIYLIKVLEYVGVLEAIIDKQSGKE